MGVEFLLPVGRIAAVVVPVFVEGQQGDVLLQGNDDGVGQAFGDAVDPVVDAADLEDQAGILQFPDLARGQVEGMGRGAGREDLDHPDAGAGDMADDVGHREDGRRQFQSPRLFRAGRVQAGNKQKSRQQRSRQAMVRFFYHGCRHCSKISAQSKFYRGAPICRCGGS